MSNNMKRVTAIFEDRMMATKALEQLKTMGLSDENSTDPVKEIFENKDAKSVSVN